MQFSAIPAGAAIFVDANVFVYSLGSDPKFAQPCGELLERIDNGDLLGHVSASVLSEVAHRLMTLEACQAFGWPYAGIVNRLQRHPDEIQKLSRFNSSLRQILAAGFRAVQVTGANVLRAAQLSIQHGLLSNDALIVAVMEEHGLHHLASNDADFDRVPAISRYSPL